MTMVKKRQNSPHDEDFTADSCEDNQINPGFNSAGLCPHIKSAIDVTKLRKALKKGIKRGVCSECLKTAANTTTEIKGGIVLSKPVILTDDSFEYEKTLWICLKCGSQLCGRSENGHALKHYKTPRSDCHALVLSTTTFEVWCYACDNEVNTSCDKILACLNNIKLHTKISIPVKTLNLPPPPLSPNLNLIYDKYSKLQPLFSNSPAFNTVIMSDTNEQQHLSSVPGRAKRIQSATESLPSVRGLSNLGNTCFFNAVLQCLAQTPFLLELLKGALEPGEEFVLPGGKITVSDTDIELPPIKGKLDGLGSLSTALVETLDALQMGGLVFTPEKLLNKFTSKCPQFKGYDQHDSHECLRHLLESVRCEDLNRYKKVILNDLGYSSQKIETVNDMLKQKCKFYGNQAADRILLPEPVFRGFLVSTLQCQDCFHTSSCHESFLDISLPINIEKPQPPVHRKSPETSVTLGMTSQEMKPVSITPASSSKHQLKKEKDKEHKAKRTSKRHNRRITLAVAKNVINDNFFKNDTLQTLINKADENLSNNSHSSTSSSEEQSDADIEDNLLDDERSNITNIQVSRGISPLYPVSVPLLHTSNGSNNLPSPMKTEKSDDSPENLSKDNSNDDENDSGIATSPANIRIIEQEMKGINIVLELGISEHGAILVMQRSLLQGTNNVEDESKTSGIVLPNIALKKLEINENLNTSEVLITAKPYKTKKKRVRTQSHSDWCSTIAPRYQCEDGECSVQSCLNNFTAVELMTGNNKVGCDECTKRKNNNEEEAKKIYTNATKQFLISSPPAVLILHLKRFQVGPRLMFKKLSKPVSFPVILDIAPFCGTKIKNLPNVNRKQKKLLYALYGVVDHSGSMYGGHYTAYVKVRSKLSSDDPRWKFLPRGSKAELDQTDKQFAKLQELKEKAEAREKVRQLRISENDSDDSSSSTSVSNNVHKQPYNEMKDAIGNSNGDEIIPSAPPGKWYYVSDSIVQPVEEEAVLKSQAYLLFYERIY